MKLEKGIFLDGWRAEYQAVDARILVFLIQGYSIPNSMHIYSSIHRSIFAPCLFQN